MGRGDVNALHELLETAQKRRWCVRPFCTTCGAREYREAIRANAPALAEALKTARIAELRRQFTGIDVDDALRLMFMELTNPFGPMLGNMRAVEGDLEGTEAGEYVAGMRRHAARRAVMQAQYEAYHSPEAVAQRRLAKAERQRVEQLARMERRRQREEAIDTALEALARLEPSSVLQKICQGAVECPLYRLSLALIERLIPALGALADTELRTLRERVPVTRVQPLAQLSLAIDAELKTRAP